MDLEIAIQVSDREQNVHEHPHTRYHENRYEIDIHHGSVINCVLKNFRKGEKEYCYFINRKLTINANGISGVLFEPIWATVKRDTEWFGRYDNAINDNGNGDDGDGDANYYDDDDDDDGNVLFTKGS